MKTSLVLLMALVSLSAWAEDLAGHYVSKAVMEVGSELLLKPDGHFEYMLAYGAADYWAKGTWRHEKEQVILDPSNKDFYFEINGDAITQVLFKDETLDIDGKALVMKYWNEQSPIRYEKQ